MTEEEKLIEKREKLKTKYTEKMAKIVEQGISSSLDDIVDSAKFFGAFKQEGETNLTVEQQQLLNEKNIEDKFEEKLQEKLEEDFADISQNNYVSGNIMPLEN